VFRKKRLFLISCTVPEQMARRVSTTALALIISAQAAVSLLQQQQQQLQVEAWGKDSIRVRAAPTSRGVNLHAPGALDAQPPASTAAADLQQPTDGSVPVVSGVLNCTVSSDGRLEFFRTGEESGEPLLAEASVRVFGDTAYTGVSNLTLAFSLSKGQKIWGLGQVESTALDLSGQCQPTAPDNGHIVIPLAHSSTGVSWFLNLPSFGTVCVDAHDKADRQFTWFSRGAFNMDLWVTASGKPATALPQAISSYVEATGKPTPFPAWTTGFWQSKNRYRSTSEVLGIAHEYQRLNIPLSLMIIDEGAWDLLGNEGWGM
jgi:alpha-D-xyloside xylohydrolase